MSLIFVLPFVPLYYIDIVKRADIVNEIMLELLLTLSPSIGDKHMSVYLIIWGGFMKIVFMRFRMYDCFCFV